jgi:hypothetical protein
MNLRDGTLDLGLLPNPLMLEIDSRKILKHAQMVRKCRPFEEIKDAT